MQQQIFQTRRLFVLKLIRKRDRVLYNANEWKKWGGRVFSITFMICVLIVVWLLLQVTTITSFRVPSYSMYPTLIPGDYMLVNKWVIGARLFDIWNVVEGKKTKIYRLSGIRKVKRNDVLVFHNPYPHSADTLAMHLLKYYVKRCIALPGDTMSIKDGVYYIKNVNELIGNIQAQKRIESFKEQTNGFLVKDVYPQDKYMDWSIRNFGPLHIPAKGQTITMDSTAAKLYGKLIEWEQKKALKWVKEGVYLGDSLIREYSFLENYYFMSGDNLEISNDSRHWGLVPEPYIVGVATRIWNSVDKFTGETRWDRVMKKIE